MRELLLALVLEHYGEVAKGIAEILLSKQAVTLKEIMGSDQEEMEGRRKEDIQYALLRMIQHAVVVFSTEETNGRSVTKYRILPERILVYGSLPCVLSLLSPSERTILVILSIHGRLTAADIAEQCGGNIEQSLGDAIRDGLIVDVETEEDEERTRAKIPKKSEEIITNNYNTNKQNEEEIIVIKNKTKRKTQDYLQNADPMNKKKPDGTSVMDPEIEDKAQNVNENAKNNESVYILSTSGVLRYMARYACISAVTSCVGDSAASALQRMLSKCGSVFGGEGVGYTAEELAIGKYGNAIEECRKGLKALMTIRPNIVEQDGSRFRLVPYGAKTLVISSIIESLILSRLGVGALRVYLILSKLEDGPIEEQDLYQRTMLGKRETRSAVYGLISMGIARTIEVPRSVDRNPTNSIYLFEATNDISMLIDDVASILLNIRDRLVVDPKSKVLLAASCHLTQLIVLLLMCN